MASPPRAPPKETAIAVDLQVTNSTPCLTRDYTGSIWETFTFINSPSNPVTVHDNVEKSHRNSVAEAASPNNNKNHYRGSQAFRGSNPPQEESRRVKTDRQNAELPFLQTRRKPLQGDRSDQVNPTHVAYREERKEDQKKKPSECFFSR